MNAPLSRLRRPLASPLLSRSGVKLRALISHRSQQQMRALADPKLHSNQMSQLPPLPQNQQPRRRRRTPRSRM